MKNVRGMSLIELMFSITLSLLIINICIAIYLTAQKNFSLQNDLSALQENARTAIQLMKNDIKQVGYIGCPKLTSDFPLINHTSYTVNWKNKIVQKSQAINIWHGSISHVNLIKSMQNDFVLYATTEQHFSSQDILIISDCYSADIFQPESILFDENIQTIITSQPLSSRYQTDAEIFRLEVKSFFTNKTNRFYPNGKPIYALYILDNINHHKRELVESIESLKTKIDLNSDQSPTGISLELNALTPFLSKTWYSYLSL